MSQKNCFIDYNKKIADDLEIRYTSCGCPKYPSLELVCWRYYEQDTIVHEVENGKDLGQVMKKAGVDKYCFVLAYFVKTKEDSYAIKLVGNRVVEYVPLKYMYDVLTALQDAQEYLCEYAKELSSQESLLRWENDDE